MDNPTVVNWILTVAGVYLIFLVFMMKTANIRSLFIFRLFPFFLGGAAILAALRGFGVI